MMSVWAQKMHRGAATLSSVVTCGHAAVPYPARMEKVKFGVALDEVCRHDIPGPLLVLILKLNKEAPFKKDVFRAPGHQGNMKKLIHFLQQGRLVNIDNYSVYTIASVLKKFLRKIPGGIFGAESEAELFQIIDIENVEEKRDRIHRLIGSLPVVSQHLLVLLFGTFRTIASSSQRAQTGMSSEALGVSVAPSFFQSCVSDGKVARMEDVVRFKVATRITKFLIDNFGVSNLFGRENYEYYARISGKILKVEEDWIFAFHYPPDALVSREASLEAEKSWLQQEAERWGLNLNLETISSQEEYQSTPALIHACEPMIHVERTPSDGSLSNLGDAYTRLSVSLEDNGLFKTSSPSFGQHPDDLKAVNRYAESTKSLSFLPLVHERQTARMRTRSEWFLNPSPCPSPTHAFVPPQIDEIEEIASKLLKTEASKYSSAASSKSSSSTFVASSCGSEKQLYRRASSKEKRLVRQSSSKCKRDKENGSNCGKLMRCSSASSGCLPISCEFVCDFNKVPPTAAVVQSVSHPLRELDKEEMSAIQKKRSHTHGVVEQDCTEIDVKTFHVTLTYKPRI